jgi:uncharacterized protein
VIASLKFLLAVAGIGYLAIVAGMYLGQRKLQYFPDNKHLMPSMVGLSGVEVLRIKTEDGENIVAWYSPARSGQSTIIYFQGNGGDISDRAERFASYQAKGMGALFVSYRGYGGSTGSPSERGLVLDAIAAYEWLASRIGSCDIVVVGESLGTGVAVQLATQRKVSAVALEAPFASAADVGAHEYWWLPVRLLMKDKFNSIEHIARIGAPLFIIHGDLDEIIPISEGRRLFTEAKEPKEMVVIKGGSHASIFEEETWARELKFFARVMAQHRAAAAIMH